MIATILAYCDVVIASGLDPYRVGAWCRAHSDGSARGMIEAVRVMGTPWELVRPEGPRDLRRWAAIAAMAPRERIGLSGDGATFDQINNAVRLRPEV